LERSTGFSGDYRSVRRRLRRLEREPDNRVAADIALGNRITVFEARMRGQPASIAAQAGQGSGQTRPEMSDRRALLTAALGFLQLRQESPGSLGSAGI
jgi:hypothetical protein